MKECLGINRHAIAFIFERDITTETTKVGCAIVWYCCYLRNTFFAMLTAGNDIWPLYGIYHP